MRSIALRIGMKGEGGAAGYPLSLFVGDDADVVRQLGDGSAPVATDIIPRRPARRESSAASARRTSRSIAARARLPLGPTAGTELLERVGTLLFDVLNRPGIAALWKQERTPRGRIAGSRCRTGAGTPRAARRARPGAAAAPVGAHASGKNALAQQSWWPIVRWQRRSTALDASQALPWPFRVLVVDRLSRRRQRHQVARRALGDSRVRESAAS